MHAPAVRDSTTRKMSNLRIADREVIRCQLVTASPSGLREQIRVGDMKWSTISTNKYT